MGDLANRSFVNSCITQYEYVDVSGTPAMATSSEYCFSTFDSMFGILVLIGVCVVAFIVAFKMAQG